MEPFHNHSDSTWYLGNAPGKHKMKQVSEYGRIGHCTHTSESANVKLRKIQDGKLHSMYHILYLQNSSNIMYPKKHGLFQIYDDKYPA